MNISDEHQSSTNISDQHQIVINHADSCISTLKFNVEHHSWRCLIAARRAIRDTARSSTLGIHTHCAVAAAWHLDCSPHTLCCCCSTTPRLQRRRGAAWARHLSMQQNYGCRLPQHSDTGCHLSVDHSQSNSARIAAVCNPLLFASANCHLVKQDLDIRISSYQQNKLVNQAWSEIRTKSEMRMWKEHKAGISNWKG